TLPPTKSGGADQREESKKDRRGGVGWRSDGGRGNSLARMMRQADRFRTRGGCSYNPRGAPCRSTAGSPDRPGANGVASTPKCATPHRTRHGRSYNPKHDAPPCRSTAPGANRASTAYQGSRLFAPDTGAPTSGAPL